MLAHQPDARFLHAPADVGAGGGWTAAPGPTTDGALALVPQTPPIRVVLVDDRTLARGGLRLLLDGEPDIEVVRGGGDVDTLAEQLRASSPDVVVLDLATPDHAAVAAVGSMREQAPQTQIVVLASERDAASAPPLMDAGAVGFVARESIARDLSAAVRAAAHGRRFISARLEPVLTRGSRPPGEDRLTTRETEVLRLIALGHTSVEIAEALHLSPRTVETHRARIHKKLGLATRAELVRHALRRGLLRA